MFRNSYLKQFLLSGTVYATTLVSGTPQDNEGAKDGQGGSCDPCTGKLRRRSELPLYDEGPVEIRPDEDQPSNLEKNISAVRKELWVWHDKCTGYREKLVDIIDTGKAHTSAMIEQLQKDELPIPRSGAIAIGGLAGVVLGLRGGWIKRIVYGSTCAGLMAAVCYPQEAKEISQEALATAKKYVQITHNFIYGEEKPETPVSVNPIDPPNQITIPDCPVLDIPGQEQEDSSKELDESQSSSSKDCRCRSKDHPNPDEKTEAE